MFTRTISSALLGLLSMPALANDPNLVAHYSLDGSSADNSGNGPAATEWNGVGYSAAGICGAAASLDGVNDYLSLPVHPLQDATISAWFLQTRDTGSWQRVWDFGSTTGQGAMFLAVEHGRAGNRVGVGIHDTSGANVQDVASGVYAGVGTWHHVVVTYDNGGAGTRLYVDGVLSAQGSYNAQSFDDFLNQTWLLGASHWNDPFFAGLIDEVRIYDRVLSASEITARRDDDVACADVDADDDGVRDEADNCRDVANPTQVDADHDDLGDACDGCAADADNDADEDGICGDIDVCPADADPAQLDADDDSYGDICDNDDDGDGSLDLDDNCAFDFNVDQADTDDDGIGNVCDADSDGDDVIDDIDACLGTLAGEAVLDDGCSVDQTCPCDGAWRNHGAYVRCAVSASEALLNAGLVTSAEKGAIVSAAAQSRCGM
ncbi:MAG: LamG domain-containing protein [Pseudomonadota bacterium]|nr:LamG domain-containing protein [Pseudomonadota bacterium]